MEQSEQRESPRGRSQLSLYTDCNRKWAFKYVKGWRPIPEQYGPLHFGSLMHDVQAVFYQTRSKEAAIDRIADLVPLPKTQTLENEKRFLFKERLDKSFEKWYNVLGENDLKNNVILMVEKELPLTLPNGYKMTVRVDRILRDPVGNETFINDTKTTGSSFEGTMDTYMKHDQPRLYIASVIENYPELRSSLSGWRTDVIYSKRAVRTPGGWSMEVGRSPVVSFTEHEIEDVLYTYAGVVDDIAGKLQYKNEEALRSLFPANYGNCYSYHKECEYKAICPFIDSQEVPPANLEIDPWLENGTVLDSFSEV